MMIESRARHALSKQSFWLVVAYFILAATVVALWWTYSTSSSNDRQLIEENQRRADANSLRADRTCLRVQAIVNAIVHIDPATTLPQDLLRIDEQFQDIPRCMRQEE